LGVDAAAAFLPTPDFDVEPLLCLRPGFVSDFGLTSVEAGAVAGPTFAFAFAFAFALTLRPSPSSFAMLERCSE